MHVDSGACFKEQKTRFVMHLHFEEFIWATWVMQCLIFFFKIHCFVFQTMVSRGGEDFARQQQWCNRFEEARFSPGVASFSENVLLRCWRPGRFALVSSRSQNLSIHGKYLVVRVLLLLLSSKRSILLWHKINKYVWTQLHFWVCPQYCTSTASF